MKIYVDSISGEEVASDVYPEKELFNGHVLALESKMVGLNEEEEIAKEGDDVVSEVNQIVFAHQLKPYPCSFKEWQSSLKPFLQKILKKLESEGKDADYIASFKKSVAEFVGFVKDKMKKNKDAFEFFIAPKVVDGQLIILMDWGEDDNTPTLYFFKDALTFEKI